MSLLAEMEKKTEERRVQWNHPILGVNLDRDARDAYFECIVFAAVADDEQVDDAERARLHKVGLSLGVPKEEVDDAIRSFLLLDGNGKVDRAAELANALRGSGVADIFLCEFSQVWTSHNHDPSDLGGIRKRLAEWMDVDYDERFFIIFDGVAAKVKTDPKAVYVLCDYLDDNVIRYLFADIFEIEKMFAEKREEEERAILPHPLKSILSDVLKSRYRNAICSAIDETSGGSPTRIQKKGIRQLSIALGVKNLEVPVETGGLTIVDGVGTALRNVAFFFCCDMARLFAVDGHASFSAMQERLLDDSMAAWKLVPEDVDFLKKYTAFLCDGKEPDAADVVNEARGTIVFPDGFIRYYTPNMKPIVLAGGDAPEGVYQIVDGHYRLETTLRVGSQTRLVIKNAVIDFAPAAQIALQDCVGEITASEFNGENTDIEGLKGKPFFSGYCKDKTVFEGCRFNGVGCRSVINSDYGSRVDIESCCFNRLCGQQDSSIIGCECSLVIKNSQWNNCCAKKHFLVADSYLINNSQWNNCCAKKHFLVADYFGKIEVIASDFVSCIAGDFLYTRYDKDVVCKACLFECCNFKRFHKYDEVAESGNATIKDNYFDKSSGDILGLFSVYLQSNCTIENLRTVRADLSNDS